MANRYVAGAAGLPFAVLRGYAGTDLRRAHAHDQHRSTCPFTGEALTAVPRAQPRRHHHPRPAGRPAGQRAAVGLTGVQKEAVLAARRSLVTVEEIVDELEPRPDAVVLPAWVVTASPRCPAAPAPPTRTATPTATTTPTGPGTRSAATATPSRSGCDEARAASRSARVSARRPTWTTDEMMTVAAARALRRRQRLLRRHRAAEHRGQPRPPHPRPRPRAGLRVRRHRRQADAACRCRSATAMLAETADAVVTVPEIFNYWLQPGRDRRRLPRRGPDRPLRQHQHHRDRRRYDHPKVRLPGRRRRAGDRRLVRRGDRRRPPDPARVRRARRLRHLGRASATGPATASGSACAARGPDAGHHRPRHPRARPATRASSSSPTCTPGVDGRPGPGGDRLGAARSPASSATTDAADRRRARRRCGELSAERGGQR